MKVKFIIYHLWDKNGNECAIVTNEPSDTVSPYSMFDENGKLLYFEAEAYYLKKWAAENDLGCGVYEHELEIEKPKP